MRHRRKGDRSAGAGHSPEENQAALPWAVPRFPGPRIPPAPPGPSEQRPRLPAPPALTSAPPLPTHRGDVNPPPGGPRAHRPGPSRADAPLAHWLGRRGGARGRRERARAAGARGGRGWGETGRDGVRGGRWARGHAGPRGCPRAGGLAGRGCGVSSGWSTAPLLGLGAVPCPGARGRAARVRSSAVRGSGMAAERCPGGAQPPGTVRGRAVSAGSAAWRGACAAGGREAGGAARRAPLSVAGPPRCSCPRKGTGTGNGGYTASR